MAGIIRFLKFIILVPLCLFLLIFSVVNRHGVTLVLDPFSASEDAMTITLPMFLFFFFAVSLGMLISSFFAWRSRRKYINSEKNTRIALDELRKEYEDLKLKQNIV